MSNQPSQSGDTSIDGSGEEITRKRARLAARDSVLQDLAEAINKLTIQSESLNETLKETVNRDELRSVVESQWRRRWRTALVLFFLVVGTTQVLDYHIEECVVDHYVHREIGTVSMCDVTFPTHAHGHITAGSPEVVEYQWPTRDNLIGLGLYGTLFIGLMLYPSIAARRRTNDILDKELSNGNGKSTRSERDHRRRVAFDAGGNDHPPADGVADEDVRIVRSEGNS